LRARPQLAAVTRSGPVAGRARVGHYGPGPSRPARADGIDRALAAARQGGGGIPGAARPLRLARQLLRAAAERSPGTGARRHGAHRLAALQYRGRSRALDRSASRITPRLMPMKYVHYLLLLVPFMPVAVRADEPAK